MPDSCTDTSTHTIAHPQSNAGTDTLAHFESNINTYILADGCSSIRDHLQRLHMHIRLYICRAIVGALLVLRGFRTVRRCPRTKRKCLELLRVKRRTVSARLLAIC